MADVDWVVVPTPARARGTNWGGRVVSWQWFVSQVRRRRDERCSSASPWESDCCRNSALSNLLLWGRLDAGTEAVVGHAEAGGHGLA
ncbi:MAG: hypothetical protein QOE57_133 [Acidimicrobiaceae bacterium]|nr:hypothetical protein [Acidimicrobiaceae bacterium]